MCARTTLTKPKLEDVADELEAELSPEDAARYRPRYNIAPSDLSWIVEPGVDHRALVPAIWGYIPQAKRIGRPLINVRGEQVASGKGFREAFTARRCVLVTDGFFEWDSRRQPTWFHRVDGRLLLIGALFQPPREAGFDQARDRHPRFTVLTTRPNRLIAKIHDRMPVVVPPERLESWLAGPPEEAVRLIAPVPDEVLEATPVSTRVNSVKNDDPECLRPVARPLEDPQGRLF
jgi:putative SOS response-associated peptidase YedK